MNPRHASVSKARAVAGSCFLASLVTLAGCGGGGEGPLPPAHGYSQADLTGTWDQISLTTNNSPGWRFQSTAVDSSGMATPATCIDQQGTCLVVGTLTYGIDSLGNVTATGTAANTTWHGTMNSAKDLIVATSTVAGGTGYSLHVFRRRVAGTWSATDVANLQFAFHELHSGGRTIWKRGAGWTDGSGAMTLTSVSAPSVQETPPPSGYDTMVLDANGLVTQTNDATFHGFMTLDKTAVFGVRTEVNGEYVLVVRLVTGGTFGQADLGGGWAYRVLTSGATTATSTWLRAVATIDAGGVVTFSSAANPSGAVGIVSITLRVAADGSITRTGGASDGGQMGLSRDLFVRTATAIDPQCAFSIAVR